MTAILVSDDTLTVRLPPVSKVAGLLRDQVIPRSAVTAVEVVPDGLAAARGLRAPGLALPGRRSGASVLAHPRAPVPERGRTVVLVTHDPSVASFRPRARRRRCCRDGLDSRVEVQPLVARAAACARSAQSPHDTAGTRPRRRCRNGVPPRAGKAGPGESLTGCLVSPD
jgi:hypothetical protein